MILKFLFPTNKRSKSTSILLLAARIIFGALFLVHGIQKWDNFDMLANVFPDPLHLGSDISLSLAIFAEVICSVGFIIGFLYRLALIPMIFTMGVAFFIIHANDAFAVKEMAFIYLVIFLLMYITGPGKYSVDYFISKK